MKAKEIILEDIDLSLEEGWKDSLTNMGIAAAIAGGGTLGLVGKQEIDNYLAKRGQDSVAQRSVIDKIKDVDIKKDTKELVGKTQQNIEKAIQSVTGSPHEKFLRKFASKAGLQGEELAAFLAQCAHESHNFRSMEEYGDSRYFRKYDPKFNPAKAKALGNKYAGDGERYKGRGYIQITGRYNYKRAGEALGLPLEENPELAENPEIAAKIALWYWKNRVQPRVNDFDNTAEVTKTINPGMKGLEKRHNLFQDFLVALHLK